MAIGRLHHVVIDCPDPVALAGFYTELIGMPIVYSDDEWVVISRDDTTSGIAFQRADGYQPPDWPDPSRPQQFHLDIMVDDPAAAEPLACALGATRLNEGVHGPRIFADPAGHPFCLINRPGWAPPINSGDG